MYTDTNYFHRICNISIGRPTIYLYVHSTLARGLLVPYQTCTVII